MADTTPTYGRHRTASAPQEYRAITSKAEENFRRERERVSRLTDGGASTIVEAMLEARQQLLSSERVSLGRYREAVNATTEDVQAALRRVTEGEVGGR